MRGLSVGVSIGRVVRLELTTGLLVGMTLAAVFIPIGWLRWGAPDVIAAVAIAMVAACSIATVVAMALPAILRHFGVDRRSGAARSQPSRRISSRS